MHRYRRILPYALRQWPIVLTILALVAATSFVSALQPWPMKILVDYALGDMAVPASLGSWIAHISPNPTLWTLVALAGLASLGLCLLSGAIGVASSLGWTAVGQRMAYDLAGDLFHRLQRLSLLFHGRRHVGDSLSRLTEDAWCVHSITEGILVSPAQQVLTLAVLGTVAWTLDPGLAALSFVVAPLLAASSLFFGHRLKRRARLSREAKSRLMSFVHQTLGAIPVVQTFATEARNRSTYQDLASEAVVLSQRRNLVKSAFGSVNGLITATGTAIIIYVGGLRVLSGVISLGSLLVFISYLRSMQGASRSLFKTWASLKSAEASIDRVLEVLDSKEEVRDLPEAKPLRDRPRGERGHVKLESVTFGYQTDRPVLKSVTLEARPDETVALVGPTGAGKSTLAFLIPRFFDPWEGRVTFDGIDARRIQLRSLRAQVSIVPQEPLLLPITVADNIAYGRPGASRDEIESVAVAAEADAFIRRLPEGYDTVLEERGTNLSGGERQRLAIARALLKDAPVLVLDEPTSALDAGTEALLLVALERLMKGRTTFIIAHRLSTIRLANRIVVLERGKVTEVGTHRELLSAEGAYHRLYSHYGAGSAEGAA